MSKKEKPILERVRKDKALMAAHRITEEELELVSKVRMFGALSSVEDVLFVLELSRRYRED